MIQEASKFIVVHGNTIELVRNERGFWEAPNGTIFAYSEASASIDPITRCGIGFFSLSPDSPLTDACRPHDFAYNSPVYQAFHLRIDADKKLRHDIAIIGAELHRPWYHAIGQTFLEIVRNVGNRFWENKETNK